MLPRAFLFLCLAAAASCSTQRAGDVLVTPSSLDEAYEVDPPGWTFKACASSRGWTTAPLVTGPRPHESLTSEEDLPRALFWGNVSGVNYLTPVRNQHLPKYCGACWAFATLASLSDRIKIARDAAFPEVQLSPQVIINCRGGGSCNGGDPRGVYEYISAHGLPDETCQAYMAADGACAPMGVCETCDPGAGCAAVTNYTQFTLKQYGDVTAGSFFRDDVSNALAMKAELAARGPIACDIMVTARFEAYAGGVFSQPRLFTIPNHVIAVVGWGVDEETGVEYWIARNSWGTAWGEGGFARIQMHSDNLGIERGCTFGVPDYSALRVAGPHPPAVQAALAAMAPRKAAPPPLLRGKSLLPSVLGGGILPAALRFVEGLWGGGESSSSAAAPRSLACTCVRREPGPRRSAVRTPQPHTYLKPSDLPALYDIRNLSGVNYASLTRNQHIPVYCGSCWAHSTASAISDRLALARRNAFPEILLAPQVLVDCVTQHSHGCEGGDPTAAYEYVMQHGITDESCAPYQALDGACTPQAVCADCSPNPLTGCYPVTPGATFRVTEHGQAVGEAQMMAEIAARGPITCGICVTPEFEAYSGGVFRDTSGCKAEMHAIEIAGYGTAPDGTPTWLGRNSWGTPWGEQGWFTLERGADALGLESIGCDWGVVEIPKLVVPY